MLGSKVVLLAIGIWLALQPLFTYAPFMNWLFGTEPLDATAWLYCLGVGGAAIFVLVDVEELLVRWRAAAGTAGDDAGGSGGNAERERGTG